MKSRVSLIVSHSMTDSEDDGCQLGRLEHWEAQYATELANLDHHADEGEIWFGDDVQQQMVQFVAAVTNAQGLDPATAAVLDVGTGNGILLAELAQLGFNNLTGSDYSQASISLAAAVMQRRGLSHVKLLVDSITDSSLQPGSFDVITDKGTLDAIGLSQHAAADRQQYQREAAKLLKPGGLLVITSCNSTQDELVEEFTCAQNISTTALCFTYLDRVKTYPCFVFGGITGTRVCTVAFRRGTLMTSRWTTDSPCSPDSSVSIRRHP